MYYTMIKQNGHLRTQRKCRKHEPQAFSSVLKCPDFFITIMIHAEASLFVIIYIYIYTYEFPLPSGIKVRECVITVTITHKECAVFFNFKSTCLQLQV